MFYFFHFHSLTNIIDTVVVQDLCSTHPLCDIVGLVLCEEVTGTVHIAMVADPGWESPWKSISADVGITTDGCEHTNTIIHIYQSACVCMDVWMDGCMYVYMYVYTCW